MTTVVMLKLEDNSISLLLESILTLANVPQEGYARAETLGILLAIAHPIRQYSRYVDPRRLSSAILNCCSIC